VSEGTYKRGRRALPRSKRGLQLLGIPEKREIFLLLEGSVLLPDAGNIGAQGSEATTARSAGCPGLRQEVPQGKRPRRADEPPHTQHVWSRANQLKTFRADGASWAAGDNEVACVRWWRGGVVGRERVCMHAYWRAPTGMPYFSRTRAASSAGVGEQFGRKVLENVRALAAARRSFRLSSEAREEGLHLIIVRHGVYILTSSLYGGFIS
jgi:hypothetical protein